MNKALILLLLLAIFATKALSLEKSEKNIIDTILDELENEIIKTKKNRIKINKLLHTEIFTDASPRSRNLITYMLRLPSSAELRHNLDAALNQIAGSDLENNYEIEKALAKILVAIIGSPDSISSLSPIMKKYEEIISANTSAKFAYFKGVSFFCSQIIGTLMFEKIKSVHILNKNMFKIISCLIVKLKKPWVREHESKVSLQIRDSLSLLNNILIETPKKIDAGPSFDNSNEKNKRNYLEYDEFYELLNKYIYSGQVFRDFSFL